MENSRHDDSAIGTQDGVQQPAAQLDAQSTTQSTQWEPLQQPQQPAPHGQATSSVQGSTQTHRESAVPTPSDTLSQSQLDSGLAELDELALRPRTSSIVLCVIFAVLFFAISGAVYFFGVHTVDGQSFEDLAIMNFASTMPSWLSFGNMKSWIVIAVSLAFGAIAFIVAAIRRRWWLLGQLAMYAVVAFAAGHFLKPILPRPLLIQVESSIKNSAPSGHTMLAAASGLILLCAMPHAARAIAAIVSTLFTTAVGISVIYDRWHRPVDVIMAITLAGALMMVMLAFTRRSGMDPTGKRVSSPSVQITATALVTLGICAIAYGAYVMWQVWPGLEYASTWAAPGVCAASATAVFGAAALVNGMVLTMRQVTAAPLSRLGLIGAPPTPPKPAARTAQQ